MELVQVILALAHTAVFSVAVLVGVASCGREADDSGPFFTEVTAASGVEFRFENGARGQRYVLETMAGGLGWIDYDGDGDQDLYLVNGHSDPLNAEEPGEEEDRLFANDGSGKFTDVTKAAGVGDRRYGFGVAVGDYDNDGHPDLLVTNFGRNTLYHNSGDRTFSDVTAAAGLVEEGFSSSAVWFDMDRDGDLDLYVARYLKYHPRTSRVCREHGETVYCHPRLFPGEADLLYRNLGGGVFEETGKPAGIAKGGDNEGKGLGVLAADFDRDGRIDVFVANDTTPNFLWRSNGDGTFTDVAQEVGVALSADGEAQAGMGVDCADIDGNSFLDIYVTNFALELNALYLGREGGAFAWGTRNANLGATYLPLGFGTLFVDVDLDGDQDIVTANGHINDRVEVTDPGSGSTYKQRAALFLNDGKGRFSAGVERAGEFFAAATVGRGLARADFDGDGDVDLALMTLDRSVVLLRNENPLRNRSVTIRLAGVKGPRSAYGARLEATVAGRTQLFECQSARSYLSASDPVVVVGLGKAEGIDVLKVHWPSGQVSERRGLKAGTVVVVREEP
jgi:hypothetical protein